MLTQSFLTIPDYYLLACALGLLGQSVRGLLGVFKRMRDKATHSFAPGFFLATLVLGGLSGVIGALVYDVAPMTPASATIEALWNDRNFVLMAISAGYFGADVIEGVLGRHAPHKPRRSRSR